MRVGVGLFVRVGVSFGVGLLVRVLVGLGLVFGEVAVLEHVNFGGGDAGAVDRFDLEGGAEVEGGYGLMEDVWGKAGVEKGSEKHIAGDAGEAIEVGDPHGNYCFTSR